LVQRCSDRTQQLLIDEVAHVSADEYSGSRGNVWAGVFAGPGASHSSERLLVHGCQFVGWILVIGNSSIMMHHAFTFHFGEFLSDTLVVP